MNIINEAINAREKLNGLIEVSKSQSMDQIYDYMENLTDGECRWMLKMITYGSWKDFDDTNV